VLRPSCTETDHIDPEPRANRPRIDRVFLVNDADCWAPGRQRLHKFVGWLVYQNEMDYPELGCLIQFKNVRVFLKRLSQWESRQALNQKSHTDSASVSGCNEIIDETVLTIGLIAPMKSEFALVQRIALSRNCVQEVHWRPRPQNENRRKDRYRGHIICQLRIELYASVIVVDEIRQCRKLAPLFRLFEG